jgi:signal transduction histidine kinase
VPLGADRQAVAPLPTHGADAIRRCGWLPAADAVLTVDPDKTHRALTNVLSNAYKYSPHGGEVSLSTVAAALGRPAGAGRARRRPGHRHDTRAGAARVRALLRADPSGNIPGTGLGMSLVKEITELHGGRVELASEPGTGTQVTLWLPLDAAQAVPRLQPPPRHLTQGS